MTFDMTPILRSKKMFRRQLATRPIEEKLALLDSMRERSLSLRNASTQKVASVNSQEKSLKAIDRTPNL